MTGTELMAVIGFFIMLSGAGWRVWARVEGKVRVAEDKADKVISDLAAHKLHVAETYTTKSGMKEIKDEILGAVSGLKDDLRHLTSRIDATPTRRLRLARRARRAVNTTTPALPHHSGQIDHMRVPNTMMKATTAPRNRAIPILVS